MNRPLGSKNGIGDVCPVPGFELCIRPTKRRHLAKRNGRVVLKEIDVLTVVAPTRLMIELTPAGELTRVRAIGADGEDRDRVIRSAEIGEAAAGREEEHRKEYFESPLQQRSLVATREISHAQVRVCGAFVLRELAPIASQVRLIVFTGSGRERRRRPAVNGYLPQRAASSARRRDDDGAAVGRPHRPPAFTKIVGQPGRRATGGGNGPEVAVGTELRAEIGDGPAVRRQRGRRRQGGAPAITPLTRWMSDPSGAAVQTAPWPSNTRRLPSRATFGLPPRSIKRVGVPPIGATVQRPWPATANRI